MQVIEAQFPAPIGADAVLVETARLQRGASVRLEGRATDGSWKLPSNAPATSDGELTTALRMDAARELRRRGIGYILAFENEADTRDLREHPDLYGVRAVAHNRDATLYEIASAN